MTFLLFGRIFKCRKINNCHRASLRFSVTSHRWCLLILLEGLSGSKQQAAEMLPSVSQWIIRKWHVDTAATTVTASVVRPEVKHSNWEAFGDALSCKPVFWFFLIHFHPLFGTFRPIAPSPMTSPRLVQVPHRRIAPLCVFGEVKAR